MAFVFFPSLESIASSTAMQPYGLLGDYVGGVLGTILSAVTLIVLYFSYRFSIKTYRKDKIHAIFSSMMSNHEGIVSSLRWGDAYGRAVISKAVADLYLIMKIVKTSEELTKINLTINDRMDVAFIVSMYSTSETEKMHLSKYPEDFVKTINGLVGQARQSKGTEYEGKGYETLLSHYFRNLYAIHKFVDESGIDHEDKVDLLRMVRATLSTNEQVMLAFNINSRVGRAWIESGMLEKYKPIKNIPNYYFFGEEGVLKRVFPGVVFEWEEGWSDRKETIVAKIAGHAFVVHLNPNASTLSRFTSTLLRLIFKTCQKFD